MQIIEKTQTNVQFNFKVEEKKNFTIFENKLFSQRYCYDLMSMMMMKHIVIL